VTWGPGTVDGQSDDTVEAQLKAALPDLATPLSLLAESVDAEFFFAFASNSPLEPDCAIADVRPGSAEIWSSLKAPIVAQGEIAGMPDSVVGVVRIYAAADAPHTWFGGRLGVAHAYRRVGAVGTALITEAVSTAHGSGCERFLATVQEANARYFEHHHFWRLETLCLLGRPHVLMQADLARYPAHLSSAWRARAS